MHTVGLINPGVLALTIGGIAWGSGYLHYLSIPTHDVELINPTQPQYTDDPRNKDTIWG